MGEGGRTMKTILVPTESHEAIRPALETALMLARRFDSYIEGFALRFRVNEFVAVDMAGAIPLESLRDENLEEARRARQIFEAFMGERAVPRANAAASSLSYGWLDDAPEGENFVGSYGRVFDVIVMSRPDADTVAPYNRAIESGLFESGRPVLLSPPTAPKRIATNIMIHWNGSTEQARANAFAMPLLHLAERVTVLTVVDGQDVPGPSADQVRSQLRYNGIAAELASIEREGRSTGEAVLAAARTEGCDLLIKGAFTRNRLRQTIFGGATSHIMHHADLPLFMAH